MRIVFKYVFWMYTTSLTTWGKDALVVGKVQASSKFWDMFHLEI
jgi:hypothetical protein